MKKRIADYFYKIIDGKLFIKDLDLGNISLTNSMEAVLDELEHQEKVDVKNLDIIHIDSINDFNQVIWDGQTPRWEPIPNDLKKEYKKLFK